MSPIKAESIDYYKINSPKCCYCNGPLTRIDDGTYIRYYEMRKIKGIFIWKKKSYLEEVCDSCKNILVDKGWNALEKKSYGGKLPEASPVDLTNIQHLYTLADHLNVPVSELAWHKREREREIENERKKRIMLKANRILILMLLIFIFLFGGIILIWWIKGN